MRRACHASVTPCAGWGLMALAVVAALFAATPSARATPSPAAAAGGCPTPPAAEVEAIARAYFAAFNAGNVAALNALLAPDFRHEGAVVPVQDRALHVQRMQAVREGFPDGVYSIEWLLVDGDMAAVRHTFRGTHRGTYTGVAATGRPVAVGAFHVFRIACGQIAENWNAGDAIGLFRQIGAMPGPATTPSNEEARPPTAAPRTPCPITTPAQNTAMARRWYDELLNQGRFEVLDDLLAEDVVHHAALFVDLNGRQETGDSLRAIRVGFPDIQYRVDGVVAQGDTVLLRWTGRGTQTGAFLGFPPSGNRVDWSGMNAFRFACGMVVEGWSEANGLAILRQIGAAVP
jgi:steroid delta-isomerase-like uncharacterized protein